MLKEDILVELWLVDKSVGYGDVRVIFFIRTSQRMTMLTRQRISAITVNNHYAHILDTKENTGTEKETLYSISSV